MALKMCKMWSNGIKTTFFPKNYEKSNFFPKNYEKSSITSGGWRLRPQTPVCDTFELQYTSLLEHVSQFTHFRILTRLLV